MQRGRQEHVLSTALLLIEGMNPGMIPILVVIVRMLSEDAQCSSTAKGIHNPTSRDIGVMPRTNTLAGGQAHIWYNKH